MQYINNLAELSYPLPSSDICIVLYILCVIWAQVKSIVLENGQSDLYDEWPWELSSSGLLEHGSNNSIESLLSLHWGL